MLSSAVKTTTGNSSAQTAAISNAYGNNSSNPSIRTGKNNPATANNAPGIQDQLASKNTLKEETSDFDKFVKYIKTHWKEILVGIAGTVLLVWGGIALSKRPKETNTKNKETPQSDSQQSTGSNSNSTPVNTSERERIILAAMRDGNEGMSCHTMATLNAVRAYCRLKGEPIPAWMNAQDGGRSKAFEILRNNDPELNNKLQDNGFIETETTGNSITERISSIILKELHIHHQKHELLTSYTANGSRYKVLKSQGLISVLGDLEDGKVGVLAISGRGGHLVTCYGFEQGRDFQLLIDRLKHSTQMQGASNWFQLDKNPQLEQIIANSDLGKIYIYDQHLNTHEKIPLSGLLSDEWLAATILR